MTVEGARNFYYIQFVVSLCLINVSHELAADIFLHKGFK
jgi:hypothetical protein